MVKAIGEPEIGNDDISVLVEEEVFEFKISVDNVLLVQVVHTGYELGKETLGIAIFEVFVGENVVK